MANGRTFLGLGMGPGGGMTPATAGLLNFGQGLLAASTAPRAQRGALMAQALNPAAMMQAKRRQDYYAMIEKLANPVIDESEATGAPPVVPPATGAPTITPGEPWGKRLLPMVPGAPYGIPAETAPAAPAAAPRPRLTPQQAEILRMAGPEAGVGLMSQIAAPKPTTLMQNLEAAGFTPGTPEYQARAAMALPGAQKPYSTIGQLIADRDAGRISQADFDREMAIRAKPTGTEITFKQMGSIPPGYKANYDAQGNVISLEAITGGPAAQKMEAAEKAKAAQQAERQRTGDIVTQDIDTILGQVKKGFPVTGVFSAAAAIPGTKAHDVSKTLDTIKANIGFDKLQAMRAASPTGGALGQVSERENVLLQSTFGSLAQSQTEEQFSRNLRRLRETYLDIIHGKGNRPTASGEAGKGVTIDLENRLRDDPSSLTEEELRELAR